MRKPAEPWPSLSQDDLFKVFPNGFDDFQQACRLIDEFLQYDAYDPHFCLKLIGVARQSTGVTWEIRRLAVLMIEHQILKLDPNNVDDFDCLLTQLNLKRAGLHVAMFSSVLKEGYSTIEPRRFIFEFRRRLGRLNRVHDKIRGLKTSKSALNDFIEVSRYDCNLTLARYLFKPEEVVSQILTHVKVSEGVRDLDPSEPPFVKEEMLRAIELLPPFEAGILSSLCEASKIYWVSEATSSEIKSLVEYPLTTVALVIKPSGSDIEFEVKRAGLRGPNSLGIVFARNGYTVPPSHRLDGGSMQYLLRAESYAASRLAAIYRLVHGTEAPIGCIVSRSTINTVPAQAAEVPTLRYFSSSEIYGDKYPEMRNAMAESVVEFKTEGYPVLPDMPGELGLTARFLGVVAPTQAVLSGTSSFRLDRLATYLSPDGPEIYFQKGLSVSYSTDDARRMADAILEEVLGGYVPPDVSYQDHEQYLSEAFLVPENRARADDVYFSLIRQMTKFWGLLLAVRGYSRGESVVARNVGLKSVWEQGRWDVKIIFMDHDALFIPASWDEDLRVHRALPSMAMDERYLCGRVSPELYPSSSAGYLKSIYRISAATEAKGEAVARAGLLETYRKTQHELLTNARLRSLFNGLFLERLLILDRLVAGHFRCERDIEARLAWQEEMRQMLTEKGYPDFRFSFDAYMEIINQNRRFLERYLYLFEAQGASPERASHDRETFAAAT